MILFLTKVIYKKQFILFIIFPLYLFGCKSPDITAQEITKPIIKTNQVAQPTKEKANIIIATITEDIQHYDESCVKKEKTTDLEEIVFLKIFGKNPSKVLLEQLNQTYEGEDRYFAAKDGVAIFRRELLMGYKLKKNKEGGYVISISDIAFNSDSTVSVGFSQSKASLSGVDKTYYLKKNNTAWEISGCEVHSYS